MERLRYMKDRLVSCIEGQLGDLSSVDAKELGEAIDMVKDLSEAIYYCTIVESMEESNEHKYYPVMYYPMDDDRRYMDYRKGRMYYDDGVMMPEGTKNYTGKEYPIELRDYREGRSPMTRKNYMEHKEMHRDKAAQMQELEKYMSELSHDLTEMIEGSSMEEKQMLQKKLSALATKIV